MWLGVRAESPRGVPVGDLMDRILLQLVAEAAATRRRAARIRDGRIFMALFQVGRQDQERGGVRRSITELNFFLNAGSG